MNVKELKEKLAEFPDDMTVIVYSASDYSEVEDAEVIEAVDQMYYFMRTHPTMSADNKARVGPYLLLQY